MSAAHPHPPASLAAGVAAAGTTPRPTPAKAESDRRRRATPRSARALLRLLERLPRGALELTLPDGRRLAFGGGEPTTRVRIGDWSVFREILRDGDIGFAQAYLDGRWHTESLIATLELAVANRDVLDAAIYGSWFGRLANRIRHALNRNTRSGSRRNISAHYDLGNAFYAIWLDPSMTYSSALFEGDERRSLGEAQQAKYQRALEALALPTGGHILEVGCGWGGFAAVAARAGMRVDGLTLSVEQLDWARRRARDEEFGDRAAFRLQDYRDERGRYDGIVSIEMFEAVGEAYWPAYFDTLARCLKPGGRALVQTITIDASRFERYRRGSDFIQQYVFPGGMLASVPRFEAAAGEAGLRVRERYGFGQDYARTLQLWRERFIARLDEVSALGFDERFVRTWEFYLAYCEAAFRHRCTDVVQFTLERR